MEALLANRILGAVTLAHVVGVKEKSVGRLISFQVNDPQNLALLDGGETNRLLRESSN